MKYRIPTRMKQVNSKINTIRLLIHDKNNDYREIFKIKLTLNKSDFYLTRKEKLKISFHKNGVKVLYLENEQGKGKFTLYKDCHYKLDGLNPIFSYMPKRIADYPVITDYKEVRHVNILLPEDFRSEDFIVKVFWANSNSNKVSIPKKDNNMKHTITGSKHDGSKHIMNSSGRPMNFGNQKLYFDIQPLNRINLDRKYENITIYKPGDSLGILEHAQKYRYPKINPSTIEKYGCQVNKNNKDDSYFVSF